MRFTVIFLRGGVGRRRWNSSSAYRLPSNHFSRDRRTNACRIVRSVGRYGRVAPPRRTLDCSDGHVCTGYGPVPDVHIRQDKNGVVPIDGVVCPGTRGYTPTTLTQEPKGSHGKKIVASQGATHGYVIFCDGVSCPSLSSSICLSVACFGLTPCTCCDATVQCLFVQRNRLVSTT